MFLHSKTSQIVFNQNPLCNSLDSDSKNATLIIDLVVIREGGGGYPHKIVVFLAPNGVI